MTPSKYRGTIGRVAMRKMITAPLLAAGLAFMIPAASVVPGPGLPKAEVQLVPVTHYEPTWKCEDCTPEEQYVLAQLQEHTKITDKNALATLMGNIKQESKFIPNICEGGARVSYENCLSGGYGLIQWTSAHRYKGLGTFCNKFACDPSSLAGQVRWMINEPIFQRYLPEFEGHGYSISQYMTPAYYWLGWGIKGNREIYAYDYESKMILV